MSLTLPGPRLVLRDFRADDWPAVYAYASRPETSRFQAWRPHTPDGSRGYVAGAIATAQHDPRIVFRLAAVLHADGTVIGSGELRLVPDQAGVIGYVIHPDYWRQGYGAEVARLLLAFGFVAHTLQHISATCDPRNLASARVLEKVGMHDDGCQHKTLLTQDGWRDSALYSIRAQEWSARSG